MPQHNGPDHGPTLPCPLFALACLTDRLASLSNHALHAGAILRWKLPRQLHQLGQPVQAGPQGFGIVCHARSTVRGGEGFEITAESPYENTHRNAFVSRGIA
jgi:hypothetical protein